MCRATAIVCGARASVPSLRPTALCARVSHGSHAHAGTPDAVLNPKKKVYPEIAPDLVTDASGVACYKGIPMQVAVSDAAQRMVSLPTVKGAKAPHIPASHADPNPCALLPIRP